MRCSNLFNLIRDSPKYQYSRIDYRATITLCGLLAVLLSFDVFVDRLSDAKAATLSFISYENYYALFSYESYKTFWNFRYNSKGTDR